MPNIPTLASIKSWHAAASRAVAHHAARAEAAEIDAVADNAAERSDKWQALADAIADAIAELEE